MGDHRAEIKIEFTFHAFHGKTEKSSWWINWCPWHTDYPGMDQRIIDWFAEMTERGMTRYDAQMAEYWREEIARDTEKSERAELERLAHKYLK